MTEKIEAIASWTLAIAIIAVLVYFAPWFFVGLITGLAIGSNIEKIRSFLEDEEETHV